MTTRIHDYRNRYWGHDYAFRPDPDPTTARITGWGLGLQTGDLLLIPRPENPETAALYRIESLRWADGVDDMWITRCRFVPASSPLGERALDAMDRGRRQWSSMDVLAAWWELPEGAEVAR